MQYSGVWMGAHYKETKRQTYFLKFNISDAIFEKIY